MKFRNILGKSNESASIEKIQSDFVTLASHQLRTPLSAVKWYAELLIQKKIGPLNKNQEKYVAEIYRSNERAIHLVNDLLDVSRIQEGKIHLELRPTKIASVIEQVIDSFGVVNQTNRVNINFEIINGPLPEIEADQEKLKRVILNLLSNSIKYTPATGKVRITVEKRTDNILINISDTGVGIPKKDQEKIFHKFFRSLNVIRMAPDGTGLGLFIAKSLIETMGGKIGFKSEEGKGATFYFTLPINQK